MSRASRLSFTTNLPEADVQLRQAGDGAGVRPRRADGGRSAIAGMLVKPDFDTVASAQTPVLPSRCRRARCGRRHPCWRAVSVPASWTAGPHARGSRPPCRKRSTSDVPPPHQRHVHQPEDTWLQMADGNISTGDRGKAPVRPAPPSGQVDPDVINQRALLPCTGQVRRPLPRRLAGTGCTCRGPSPSRSRAKGRWQNTQLLPKALLRLRRRCSGHPNPMAIKHHPPWWRRHPSSRPCWGPWCSGKIDRRNAESHYPVGAGQAYPAPFH
jgi:hypothetical protein